MRSAGLVLLLSSFAFAACAPAAEEAGEQESNATGGKRQDASSFVYVFGAGTDPLCAGVLLSGKVAVIPRTCAEGNITVGKADRGASTWWRANVTKVHIPERGPADIAVIELSSDLGAGTMLVTHAPLRAGYTLFARQSVPTSGWTTPDVNDATSLDIALTSGTDTLTDVLPLDGKKLCQRDLGAMVCSSMELSWGDAQKCGLAGIVVGAPPDTALDAEGCSTTGWKLAPLGIYADFIKQYAPKALQPERGWTFLGGDWEYAPNGLWGYETSGTVKTCSITTTEIDAAKPNETKLLRAKASFEQMAKRAAPVANFGIAKKGFPNAVRWVPATRGSTVKATSFDETFTGSVGAAEPGEFVVALRISGDGGETWKRCDDANAPLKLVVGGGTSGVTPPTTPPVTPPATPPVTPPTNPPVTPPVTPPTNPPANPPANPPKGSTPDDADDDDSTEAPPAAPTTPEPGPKPPTKTTTPKDPNNVDRVMPAVTTTTEEGCSASPHRASSSALPFVGVLLGLAAILRRRRG